MRTLGIILVTGLACATPRSVLAQRATSLDIGVLGAANPLRADGSLLQVGLRVATVQPRTVGIDFALATLPVAAAQGVLVLGADLDASWPVALGDSVRLIPRAGVSSAFGVALDGEGDAAGAVGYNAGLGLLLSASPTMAVRLDYTYRRLAIDQESLPLSSITIGVVWLR